MQEFSSNQHSGYNMYMCFSEDPTLTCYFVQTVSVWSVDKRVRLLCVSCQEVGNFCGGSCLFADFTPVLSFWVRISLKKSGLTKSSISYHIHIHIISEHMSQLLYLNVIHFHQGNGTCGLTKMMKSFQNLQTTPNS